MLFQDQVSLYNEILNWIMNTTDTMLHITIDIYVDNHVKLLQWSVIKILQSSIRCLQHQLLTTKLWERWAGEHDQQYCDPHTRDQSLAQLTWQRHNQPHIIPQLATTWYIKPLLTCGFWQKFQIVPFPPLKFPKMTKVNLHKYEIKIICLFTYTYVSKNLLSYINLDMYFASFFH